MTTSGLGGVTRLLNEVSLVSLHTLRISSQAVDYYPFITGVNNAIRRGHLVNLDKLDLSWHQPPKYVHVEALPPLRIAEFRLLEAIMSRTFIRDLRSIAIRGAVPFDAFWYHRRSTIGLHRFNITTRHHRAVVILPHLLGNVQCY